MGVRNILFCNLYKHIFFFLKKRTELKYLKSIIFSALLKTSSLEIILYPSSSETWDTFYQLQVPLTEITSLILLGGHV